jgi:hypothetical protein
MNFDELRVRLYDESFEGQSSVTGVAGVGRICQVCFGMNLKPKQREKKNKAPLSVSKGACEDDVMCSDASKGSRALVSTFV